MRKWTGRVMLVAFGILLGAVFMPSEWQAGLQHQTDDATADAPERLLAHPTLNQQYVSWEDISKMVTRCYVG